MQRRGQALVGAALALLVVGGIARSQLVRAEGPPTLDYFRPYGKVASGGGPLIPAGQPLVALIRGGVCGQGQTSVATEPAADAGQTVYALQVLAAGSDVGQQPGCGRSGDVVLFYFPAAHRIARETPPWQPGDGRYDLTLTTTLSRRVPVPMTAAEP